MTTSPLFTKLDSDQLTTILTTAEFSIRPQIEHLKQQILKETGVSLHLPADLDKTVETHLNMDREYFSALKPLITEFLSGLTPQQLADKNPGKYTTGITVPKYAKDFQVKYTLRRDPSQPDTQMWVGVVENWQIPKGKTEWELRTVLVGNFKWHAGEKGEPAPIGPVLKTLLNPSGKSRHMWGVGIERGMTPKNFAIFWENENPTRRMYMTFNAVMKEILADDTPKIVAELSETPKFTTYHKFEDKQVAKTEFTLGQKISISQWLLKESSSGTVLETKISGWQTQNRPRPPTGAQPAAGESKNPENKSNMMAGRDWSVSEGSLTGGNYYQGGHSTSLSFGARLPLGFWPLFGFSRAMIVNTPCWQARPYSTRGLYQGCLQTVLPLRQPVLKMLFRRFK